MVRYILAAAAGVCLMGGASAAQLPPALEAALSQPAADIAPQRVALRMTVDRQSILVEVRPGAEGTSSTYTLLQPADEAALSEEQAEMWAGFGEAGEDGSEAAQTPGQAYSFGGYDREALRDAIGAEARLEREEGGRRIYSFQPQSLPGQGGDDEDRQALINNLAGEIEIGAEDGRLAAVRFDLVDSFKPHMAARIHEFFMEQRFVHEPVLGGPRFSGLTLSMAGSAVFQPFSQTMEIELVSVRYGDQETLEAAPESP
jgi:hypothetical protein